MADAGSISGADTGEGDEDGGQRVNHRIWTQPLEPEFVADAAPAALINTNAKLICRNTMKPSMEREECERNSSGASLSQQRRFSNLRGK
jgi:hypothetical protein